MTELNVVDFSRYRTSVESLAENDSNLAVPCTQPQNASSLYEVIFDRAKESIRIFDPHLSPDLFENKEVLRSLERAVERHVGVDVFAGWGKDSEKVHKYLREFSEESPFVSYTQIPKGHKILDYENERCVVVDSKALRFVNSEGDGIAYMNNPEIAEKLLELFYVIKEKVR